MFLLYVVCRDFCSNVSEDNANNHSQHIADLKEAMQNNPENC